MRSRIYTCTKTIILRTQRFQAIKIFHCLKTTNSLRA
ncbi:hypothetical protein X975_08036, partial [Stegodyphus mimosarum]